MSRIEALFITACALLLARCGAGGPECGDGFCQSSETPASCPADCDTDPNCGDSVCAPDEDTESCPEDCGSVPSCGDGTCDAGETTANCPVDCPPFMPVCGNEDCEPGENVTNCPEDCVTGPSCGDGQCTPGENVTNCPADCSAGVCGDGTIAPNEDCEGADLGGRDCDGVGSVPGALADGTLDCYPPARPHRTAPTSRAGTIVPDASDPTSRSGAPASSSG